MPGALEGIRILEFSQIIAGPFGGMMLADMGADVIKVEPPEGEPWRLVKQFIPNESHTYISLNRGKRSLPLDLKRPEATEIVHKLISRMDAVVINTRADVPYDLGIDYETLSAINPRLVYCDNTAYGRKGPQAHMPGYDNIVQGMTGLMAAEGKIVDGVPERITASAVADFATGIAIAWGVCAGLFHRERTGKGQRIETTLMATALGMQTSRFMRIPALDEERHSEFFRTAEALRSRGAPFEQLHEEYNRGLDPRLLNNVYYRTYRVRDGVLTVGCLSDRLRKRLVDALGLEDIRFQAGYDPESAEAEAADVELAKSAEAVFAQKTVEEWLDILDRAGVPAGPVRFVEELIDDEQVIANDMIVEVEHSLVGKLKMMGPLIRMSETPLEPKRASPALGEHSAEILAELGYGADEIQRLKDDGVTR